MFKKLLEIFLYCSFSGLSKEENRLFIEWRQEQVHKQITYISAITAILYIFLSFINRWSAPQEIASYMANIQLFLIPPFILLVTYLAYAKKKYLYIELALFFAPLYAAAFHLHILSRFENFNIYQVELYLMIFWIFTISGLRLAHATISAFIVFLIGSLSALLFYPSEPTSLIMHITWMLVSLIFGFSGGYLLEESQKSTFLKQIELEELVQIDKLTGLYNRQKLEESIEIELENSRRYKHNFGIIIFDIDHFKSVNDTYGHQVGDSILVEISKVAKEQIRLCDTLFRWGGEEFILICLEVNRSEIELIAQKLKNAVQSRKYPQVTEVTISLGMTINQQNDEIMSIIKRADDALYLAKNSGRNCAKYL